MHVGMILEMAADGLGDRVAYGPLEVGLTFAELGHRARRAGTLLADGPNAHVVLVDEIFYRPTPTRRLARGPIESLAHGHGVAQKGAVAIGLDSSTERLRALLSVDAPAHHPGPHLAVRPAVLNCERIDLLCGATHRFIS